MTEKVRYTPIAVAIHPITDYQGSPMQKEIQSILDDPFYFMTFGVKAHHGDRPYGQKLYVIPRKIIESPSWNPRDREYSPLFRQLNPNDLIDPKQPLHDLSVTLIGGEVQIDGSGNSSISGCHYQAFRDLIKWFFNEGNTLSHLQIMIPYNAVFYPKGSPNIAKNIDAFRRKYQDTRAHIIFRENEAVFEFDRDTTSSQNTASPPK